MISQDQAMEKMEEGWIQVNMFFEVLAINEDAAISSLETIINKIDNEPNAKIFFKKNAEPQRVEKPLKDIEVAYSSSVEIKAVLKRFEDVVHIVIKYGPSAIEIISPKNITMNMGEAQGILNMIAELMHRFAAAGAGGIVFMRPEGR